MKPLREQSVWRKILGTSTDADDINHRLDLAGKKAHVLSPAPMVGILREGLGVTFTAIQVDADDHDQALMVDTAGPGGEDEFILTKTTLERISSALGLSWGKSARTDDGRHPYYCTWQAFCSYPTFDARELELNGDSEVDLRARTDNANRLAGYPERLAFARRTIQAQAQTKARLRAIRSFGLKGTYTRADLNFPFVCVQTVLVGKVDQATFSAARASLYSGGKIGRVVPMPSLAGVGDLTLPAGASRGMKLSAAALSDLQHWRARLEREVLAGASTANQPLLDAIKNELAARATSGQGGEHL